MGSSSSWGLGAKEDGAPLRGESGEATSKTLLPTLSWKLARGSTGSGLAAKSRDWMAGRVVVGLLFELLRPADGPHVLREAGR